MRFSMTPLSPGAIADCCRCCLPSRKGGRRPISVADAPMHSPVMGIAAQRRIAARTEDRRLATARSGMDPVPLLRDTLLIRLGQTRLGRRPLPVFISRAFADTWSGSCPVHETLADVVYRVLGDQGACSLAAMRRRFAEHMLGDPVAVQAQRHGELDHDHRTGGIGWHWIGGKLQGWRYGPQKEVGEIVKEVGDNVEVDTGFVV